MNKVVARCLLSAGYWELLFGHKLVELSTNNLSPTSIDGWNDWGYLLTKTKAVVARHYRLL